MSRVIIEKGGELQNVTIVSFEGGGYDGWTEVRRVSGKPPEDSEFDRDAGAFRKDRRRLLEARARSMSRGDMLELIESLAARVAALEPNGAP